MRTLVLTSTFPQWEGDPRGAFIRRYWEAQASATHQVEILAPRTRWCVGELSSELRVHRFRYAPQRCSTVSGEYGILENLRARPHRVGLLPPFLATMYGALRQHLARARYDCVAAHMLLPCGIVASMALDDASIDFQIYGHGTDVDLLLGAPSPMRRLSCALLRKARVVYLPSEEKRSRVRASLPEIAGRCEVATMVNTVPCETITRRPIPGRVLFLGRLIRQKGVGDLIRAVAGLGGGTHLHIAGDGPERARLTSLARRVGVDAVFHGYVEGARKREALASASVLCVPSREIGRLSEGAPLVVREARTIGLPVVATRVGGIPELAAGDALVTLVPAGDNAALRSALREFCAC